MNPNDDDAWLDALAGRDTAASPSSREAAVLRGALRTGAEPGKVFNLAVRNARREQQLLERAARAGLIAQAPRAFARHALPIAASLLLVVAAGFFVQTQTGAPPQVVRGVENGIVQLEAADPAALKQRILDALRKAGVEATGYEALGVHGIDADLPQPLTPAVGKVLDEFRIPAPADGVLRIEIRSPP